MPSCRERQSQRPYSNNKYKMPEPGQHTNLTTAVQIKLQYLFLMSQFHYYHIMHLHVSLCE